MNWVKNKNYEKLPKIEIGDRVNIHCLDSFHITLQCIVENFKDKLISVEVHALFETGSGEIDPPEGNNLYGYKGKKLAIEKYYIQK